MRAKLVRESLLESLMQNVDFIPTIADKNENCSSKIKKFLNSNDFKYVWNDIDNNLEKDKKEEVDKVYYFLNKINLNSPVGRCSFKEEENYNLKYSFYNVKELKHGLVVEEGNIGYSYGPYDNVMIKSFIIHPEDYEYILGNKYSSVQNKKEVFDYKGQSTLYNAIWNNNEEVVRNLIESGENPNQKDSKGRSMLSNALIKGNINIIKILLDNGALIDKVGGNGYYSDLDLVKYRYSSEYSTKLEKDKYKKIYKLLLQYIK